MSGEESPSAAAPQLNRPCQDEDRLLGLGAASSSADDGRDPSKDRLEVRLHDTTEWSKRSGESSVVRFQEEAPESGRPEVDASVRGQQSTSSQHLQTPESGRLEVDASVKSTSSQAWSKSGDSPPNSAAHRVSSRGPRVSAYPGRQSIVAEPIPRRTVQQRIQLSPYYRGETAAKMRTCVHGKAFLLIMTICLFIALFMPEIWVLCGINSNTEVDIVLTLVMVLFCFEFLALTFLDATYFLSFFFVMDIIGTLSMIFDISFMIGTDNTKIQTYSNTDSGAKRNLMLMRATRAARVGARAGRLSRVLRILRFLPFLNSSKAEEGGGIAASISRQLANLLATRVACLTIILVIVIPAFDILSFPQSDHSLQTWVERLSMNLDERTAMGNMSFTNEIESMATFFEKRSYGPYMACSGRATSDYFICTEDVAGSWTHVAPTRSASALWVHTDDFMVGFNMHNTQMLDKGLAILQIGFIIGIMIFSGLALSNVVTELAVRPLERMLKTVRSIAEQVFKMSSGLLQEDEVDDNEEFDINTSTEMKLLEKVVTKLSVIADLQSGRSQQVEEDMGEEDVGILNMMQGKDVVQEVKKQTQRRVSRLNKGKGHAKGRVVQLEEAGIKEDLFNSYSFNSLVLNKQQMTTVGVYVISRYFESDDSDGFIHTEENKITLEKFVHAAEKEYLSNPFHNFSHAIDVLHGVARMMRMVQSENFLTELEHFAMLVAAIGHDIGHPGVNNGFLSEVGHELALQYNDLSPLENMHVSKLYGILVNQETNVFAMLSKEQYKEVRKYCIETILHTDMMGHQAMVKELQMLFQMNSEIFTHGVVGEAQIEVFSTTETKMLMMDNFLHSADVSNPCRIWEVSHAWAQCVLEEFFSQGDQEKMLGVPVQFLNDRDKLNRPNSQIGFLEFMIAPFFAAQIRIFNALHEYGDNLAHNLTLWEDMWVKEVQPDDEARAKVRARVEKVRGNLEDANQSSARLQGANCVSTIVRPSGSIGISKVAPSSPSGP